MMMMMATMMMRMMWSQTVSRLACWAAPNPPVDMSHLCCTFYRRFDFNEAEDYDVCGDNRNMHICIFVKIHKTDSDTNDHILSSALRILKTENQKLRSCNICE